MQEGYENQHVSACFHSHQRNERFTIGSHDRILRYSFHFASVQVIERSPEACDSSVRNKEIALDVVVVARQTESFVLKGVCDCI